MKGKCLFILLLFILLTSLNPNNIYLVVLLGLFANALLPKSRYWDATALLLLVFSVLYSLIQIDDGRVGSWFLQLSYILCPVAFYRLGQYYTEKVQTKADFITLWAVMILCYSLPLAMETFNSINTIGIVNPFRTMGSEGGDVLAATLYGMHASLGLSGIAILFSNQKDIKIQKIILLFSFFVSLLTIIHLINRTGLVVIAVCIVASLFYSGKIGKGRLLSSLIVVAAVVYLLVSMDVIDPEIIEAYTAREEKAMGNSAMEAGGRIVRWENAIEHLFTSPWGFPNEVHAHNLWLDIARISGIFAFIPFLIATILNYVCVFKIIRRGEGGVTPLLLGLNIVMFLSSYVEPVIEGSFLYFYLYMFLLGVNKEICRERIR